LGEADEPLWATRYPLCSPEDMEEAFEAAARSGLYTPKRLEWMRQHKIRPASKRWTPPTPAKLRPWWLAFLLRTWDRFTGKRPFFD
jgi:hypothetical protein